MNAAERAQRRMMKEDAYRALLESVSEQENRKMRSVGLGREASAVKSTYRKKVAERLPQFAGKGMTYLEVAEALGCSVSAVCQAIARTGIKL